MIDVMLFVKTHHKTKFTGWPRGPKKPDQFRKFPLKGLWKAHTVPQSLDDYSLNVHQEFEKKWILRRVGQTFC